MIISHPALSPRSLLDEVFAHVRECALGSRGDSFMNSRPESERQGHRDALHQSIRTSRVLALQLGLNGEAWEFASTRSRRRHLRGSKIG